MPIISTSSYHATGMRRSAHFQTIYPTLFRSVQCRRYQRERINTVDGDFLDLDWARHNHDRLVIMAHGLEGSTDTHYMRGMTKACELAGWDTLGFNYRGCGGTINTKAHGYTSGGTDDIAHVIEHAMSTNRYRVLALVGFSLGGNIVLKYMGENRTDYPRELCGAAAVSAPCHLSSCTAQIQRVENRIYHARFVRSLVSTMTQKKHLATAELKGWPEEKIKTIKQFDDTFTAPFHGYADAEDYYHQNSSLQHFPAINRPTLILNALDDPILPADCYPRSEADQNQQLYLETPKHGGHLGFMRQHNSGTYWHEERVTAFLNEIR